MSPVMAISFADPDPVQIGQQGVFLESPMVLVWVTGRYGRGRVPIERCRQQAGRTMGCIEWSPGVEDESGARRMLDLDAGFRRSAGCHGGR